MTQSYFKLNGVDGLTQALKRKAAMTAAKAIVKVNTIELAEKTQQNMAGTYKNPTGATKRQTLPRFRDQSMTGFVAPGTEYFPYVENGTRFMAPEPTLKPAFDEQRPKFIDDLRKLVK